MVEYKQLKDIKLADILGLEDGAFRTRCIARLLECGFIEKDEGIYRKGQKFKEKGGGIYILAQVDTHRMGLISIVNPFGEIGNHWTNPVTVQDSDCVTEQELKKMSGVCGEFKLIEE